MQTISLIGLIHFLAGGITLLAGTSALFLRKGTKLHKLSGRVFVCFMLVLALSGLWMSIEREILFTVFLALITIYSFLTGWATLSKLKIAKRISSLSPTFAFALFLGAVLGGVKAANSPGGELNGLPYGAFYFIAFIAFSSLLLDLRYMRIKTVTRKTQLIRHVWRMGFALFLSTSIFFFGNNHVLPEAFRTPTMLSAPVVIVVLITLAYIFLLSFNSKAIKF